MTILVGKTKTQKQEVNSIVQSLNDHLDNKWSKKQLKEGMSFRFKDQWLKFVPYILKKYRSVGWAVNLSVTIIPKSREYYLEFKHPDQFS